MKSLPEISVVIPAFNAAETIERTLDSVLAQTSAPAEIIVIDDGSTDATCEVIARYGDAIRVLSQSNAGPAAARNYGLRESKSDWVAFLDADDVWLPKKLERQLPHCQSGVGLVHCYEFEDHDKYQGDGLDFETLWSQNYIGTSTVIVSKNTLERIGGFVEDRVLMCIEDYNLWLRIAASEDRIVTVKETLSHYTPSSGNLSSQFERVIKAELFNVDLIAKEFQLPSEMIHCKQLALYEEYGKAFLWSRNLPLARKYYGDLLKQQPTFQRLGCWLATFLPTSVLNARRTATATA